MAKGTGLGYVQNAQRHRFGAVYRRLKHRLRHCTGGQRHWLGVCAKRPEASVWGCVQAVQVAKGTGLGAVYKRPEMPGCGCVQVASTGLELSRDTGWI